MFLSIIISTFNPSVIRLKQTLENLKNQTLDYRFWELIIVDNNSTTNFTANINLSWHPNTKIILEPNQGLTYARIKGFNEASGEIIIMVDDDNVLDLHYLENALNIFKNQSELGAAGGKSCPIFEINPPKWLIHFHSCLALRDLGNANIVESWENRYPNSAPIGAGMVIRKKALNSYINKINTSEFIISDRKGKLLSSGGDNDIVLEILKSGWKTGYFPSLVLYHIMPRERLSAKYVARLLNNSNKSWIQLSESHGINSWEKIPSWSRPLRKFKAWVTYKAWLNKINYIKWCGACGMFDGLSEI